MDRGTRPASDGSLKTRGAPQFAVIVPAKNASATLSETIDSLSAQTFGDWEAIVVDDASTDDTHAIASARAASDPRVRVVVSDAPGLAAARNTGLRFAGAEWVVFLDSDDMLTPTALASFADGILRHIDAGAVVGGWARTTPGGAPASWQYWQPTLDVFEGLSMFCPFPVHACAVRRSLIDAVGGFDPTFSAAADWDFWQRVARTGAQFATVDEIVCLYRMRPGSMSLDAPTLHEEGTRVIAQGHTSDDRVPHASEEYAHGRPAEAEAIALLRYACWTGGLAIGAGEDPIRFLPLGRAVALPVHRKRLDATVAAFGLREALLLSRSLTPEDWPSVWREVAPRVRAFLDVLEGLAGITGLASRSEILLTPAGSSLPEGVFAIEMTRPVEAIRETARDRVLCVLRLEGRTIDILELPVCDGIVPAHVVADAMAARCFWPVLTAVLERHGAIGPGASPARIWAAAVEATAEATRVTQADDAIDVSVAGVPVGRIRADAAEDAATALNPEVLIAAVREGVLGRELDRASFPVESSRRPPVAARAVGRRVSGAPGTAAYRRATLPRACASELEAAATAAGEHVIVGAGDGVEYAPELDIASGALAGERPRDGPPLGPMRAGFLPILRYSAGDVAAHVAFFAERGYRSVIFDEWQDSARNRMPAYGRALMLVFDEDPRDFRARVWPVVRERGFGAVLLVDVANDGLAHDVRELAAEGVEVGPRLSAGGDWPAVVREASTARTVLTRAAGRPPVVYWRDDGAGDDAARRLIGGCGYPYGLTDVSARASYADQASHLPTISVAPTSSRDDLVRRLTS